MNKEFLQLADNIFWWTGLVIYGLVTSAVTAILVLIIAYYVNKLWKRTWFWDYFDWYSFHRAMIVKKTLEPDGYRMYSFIFRLEHRLINHIMRTRLLRDTEIILDMYPEERRQFEKAAADHKLEMIETLEDNGWLAYGDNFWVHSKFGKDYTLYTHTMIDAYISVVKELNGKS